MTAGFGVEPFPRITFPLVCGKLRQQFASSFLSSEALYVGHEALTRRNVLQLSYPIRHGAVHDWSKLESIWQYTFEKLHVVPKKQPLVFSVSPGLSISERDKIIDSLFERFEVPAVWTPSQPVMSLYCTGRCTGLVVDIGDTVTFVVPIVDGALIHYHPARLELGGSDITEYRKQKSTTEKEKKKREKTTKVASLLSKRGFSLNTYAEMEEVRLMKENFSYCALDYAAEVQRCTNTSYHDDIRRTWKIGVGENAKEVVMSEERFQCTEVLFQPMLLGHQVEGLAELIVKVVGECPIDTRRELLRSILITGGTSLTSGLPKRLERDVQRQIKDRGWKADIKVIAHDSRHRLSWRGISCFLDSKFLNPWLSIEEYREAGPRAHFTPAF